MDVWAILSLISGAAERAWERIAHLVGPWPQSFAVVALSLAAAMLLLAIASPRRKSTRKEPIWKDEQNSAGHLPTMIFAADKQSSDAMAPEVPGSKRDILARLEAKRGSRVVAIIHRENMERDHLDVIDLEDALTAIRRTPKNKPLDIILHTPGGHIRTGQQIARAIKSHPGKTTVFVPYYALGSATFMAYAADQIVMGTHAALSPFDPFVGVGMASSVLTALKGKSIAKVSDEAILCADIAQKLLGEARRVSCELIYDGKDYDGVCRLSDELVSGKWSSDRAISATDAKEIGLNVAIDMPAEVYELVRSFRRPQGYEPSVTALDSVRIAIPVAKPPFIVNEQVPIGLYDNIHLQAAEREKPKASAKKVKPNQVWLAEAGTYVPQSTSERAKAMIRKIEHERGSRVICIIHGPNMEREAFDFDDLEDTLSVLIASEPNKPLDIVLHTQGGLAFAGRQIARAVKAHRARKTVFVPYYAMSAGTRVSLACDQIVMGAHATLGPIDTQLYGWPAPSLLKLVETKPADSIRDEFLILAEEARKVLIECRSTACDLMKGTYSNDGSCAITDELISGRWTHGFGITADIAVQLGLNVSTELGDIFYDLVRCFRHSGGEEPSVLYIPR